MSFHFGSSGSRLCACGHLRRIHMSYTGYCGAFACECKKFKEA
jgi:hypothetical protein